MKNLRKFLKVLKQERQLLTIDAEVDPYLEVAEIHRRVIEMGGPALLFKRLRGSPFPVVTNLFGSVRRIELAFGTRPEALIRQLVEFTEQLFPLKLSQFWNHRNLAREIFRIGTRTVSQGPVLQCTQQPADLNTLPILTTWDQDGGPFITLPLVYTEHPRNKTHNLGIYRMQCYNSITTGMHWQIQKGGGFHYEVAESLNQNLPVTVFLGGPPALILAAVTPLPENIGELLVGSLLAGERIPMVRKTGIPHPFPAEAEFVLLGNVPPQQRHPEGPFGDHYGYYSLKHDYPIFNLQKMFHRTDAIYPATVVGKPKQEDFFIGDYLQKLLSPIFPMVMPGVRDLWSYGEVGFHSLTAAVVHERYNHEAMTAAFRILGEGQLSLTKFLIAVNTPIDLKNFPNLLCHVLERIEWETDLFVISNISMDTLDYSGPKINEGSKAIMLGLGSPKRKLPHRFQGDLPSGIREAHVFCPGCLVLAGPKYSKEDGHPERFISWPAFRDWPLLILVDEASCASSSAKFLWTVFTRFEPAADIYSKNVKVHRHHLRYSPPILIDSRMKTGFPEELFCLPEIAQTVDERWSEYFPKGLKV